MPPASFFLVRIAWAILGLLFFKINFMIAFSSSMKNVIGQNYHCFIKQKVVTVSIKSQIINTLGFANLVFFLIIT